MNPDEIRWMTFRLFPYYDYLDRFFGSGIRHSNYDPGSYPANGEYVHRHGGIGNRTPRCLLKKPRNRRGLRKSLMRARQVAA